MYVYMNVYVFMFTYMCIYQLSKLFIYVSVHVCGCVIVCIHYV